MSDSAVTKKIPMGNWSIHLALVLIFIGLIFANNTFAQLKQAGSYDNWPVVMATVLDCSDETTNGFWGLPFLKEKGQVVTCKISTRGLVIHSFFHSRGKHYQPGQTVEMRVDPMSPQHTVVNPSASNSGNETLLNALAFAVFALSGVFILIAALKKNRPKAAKQ